MDSGFDNFLLSVVNSKIKEATSKKMGVVTPSMAPSPLQHSHNYHGHNLLVGDAVLGIYKQIKRSI